MFVEAVAVAHGRKPNSFRSSGQHSLITWIASYLKSGSTWFRILFEALTQTDAGPVSINGLERVSGHAATRSLFEEFCGVRASDLPREVVERMRPRIYAAAARSRSGLQCMKVHDAWTHVAPSEPLFPRSATAAVIYLARNPLDVAVSLRFHLSVDQDAAIDFMANPRASISAGTRKLPEQLPQCLRRWSDHAASWLIESQLPVHLVRYEDLKSHPFETLRRAATFLDMPTDGEHIRKAIDAAAFDRLQAQEASCGFRERHRSVSVFFRRGESGAWRTELSESQVARIVAEHAPMMRHLGYLDEAGRLLC